MIKRLIISTNLIIFSVAIVYYFNADTSNKSTVYKSISDQQTFGNKPSYEFVNNQWSPKALEIIRSLQEKYSNEIHLIQTQASLLALRPNILQALPLNEQSQLNALLAEAFPEHYKSLISVWHRLDQYQDWLVTENKTIMELDPLNRSGFLWEKRNELFPMSARNIWSEEQDNYENAQISLYREIDFLDDAFDVSVHDKIERLKTSFQKANTIFSHTIDQQSEIHQGTISSVLFGLSSVQKELQNLDPEQRQSEIDSIRRELGFSEDAIAKMTQVDNTRNTRWNNGYQYMKSREALITISQDNQNTSAELEQQLAQLRSQYFGNSSPTIEREEADGFFRFQRPRYYGRN